MCTAWAVCGSHLELLELDHTYEETPMAPLLLLFYYFFATNIMADFVVQTSA